MCAADAARLCLHGFCEIGHMTALALLKNESNKSMDVHVFIALGIRWIALLPVSEFDGGLR